MWLDALALALLALFAGVGALRGALASGLGLLSLGVAYAAAFYAAPRCGPWLAERVGSAEWVGLPLAGSAVFLLVYLVMGGVSLVLRRRERRLREGSREAGDRLLGGLFGAVRGTLVVLLLAWMVVWLEALRGAGALEAMPELGPSAAASVAETVVEAGVGAAMSDEGTAGRVVARIAARPAAALEDVQGLLEHPGIADLQGDALFWTYVEHDSVDAALNRLSFTRLAYDSSFRQQLGELGLIESDAVGDPQAFRAAVAEVLREVGPRIRRLREDPALQDLMRDPEVAAMVQSGDHLGLFAHPGFQAVVAHAMKTED